MTTLAARVSARLREALQDPEHYARRRHKSAQGQQEFRWITIGAQDHEGGTHVQIKSSTGEIVAGPDALTGKKVGELGKPDAKKPEAKSSEKPARKLDQESKPDSKPKADPAPNGNRHADILDHLKSGKHTSLSELKDAIGGEGLEEDLQSLADDDRISMHTPRAGEPGLWMTPEQVKRHEETSADTVESGESEESPKAEQLPDSKQGDPIPVNTDEPRKAAGDLFQKEYDSEYAFARKSAVPNFGDDVKNSARHKRNSWRGLEQAEKDGTAAEFVTRDSLMKLEPHDLIERASKNPMTSLAMYYALRTIPAKPGYNGRGDNAHSRADFHEMYGRLKEFASQQAATQPDPAKAVDAFRSEVQSIIREFRGRPKREGEIYNWTAESMIAMQSPLSSWKRRGNAVMAKLEEFARADKKKYGEHPDVYTDIKAAGDRIEKIKEHVKDIIEGVSLPATFGDSRKSNRFNPADLYVKIASRKGGKDVSAMTSSGVKAASSLTDHFEMKGLQWGNSVTDDERKHHAAKLVEAFTDLADTLGIKPEDVSLGGNLSMAIGARGKSNALAHYEPGLKVINMTRVKGVGSLAHEWGHAFDDLAENKGRFLSDSYHGSELVEAMNEAHQAMRLSGFENRLQEQLQDMPPKERMYWNSRKEKFARCFERYIQRKLENTGRSNTYLSGIETKGYKQGGYWPVDAEIDEMSDAFDGLFAAYRKAKYGSEQPQRFSREELADFYAKQLGFNFDEAKHPRDEGGRFSKKKAAESGKSYNDWSSSISDAFRSGDINEDHPAWKALSSEAAKPGSVDDFRDYKNLKGQHVRTSNGHHGVVVDAADDLSHVVVEHEDGGRSKHFLEGLDHLGARIMHDLGRGRPSERDMNYMAGVIAKEMQASGQPVGEAMKAHGLEGVSVTMPMRKLIAEKLAEAKSGDGATAKPKKPEPSAAHKAVASRFGIPPEAVQDIASTDVKELRRRDEYTPPNYAGDGPVTDYEDHPLGTARIMSFGDPNEAYVDFMHEFDPKDLTPTEHEDGVKQRDKSYPKYVEWAKAGHKPPPISAAVSEKTGKYLSMNRRRVLAAQDAGVKSIKGWLGVNNKETGNPLKYGDVMRALKEHEQKSAKPEPAPAKPSKAPGVAGIQQGLFGQDTSGQKSLFNVAKPSAKKPVAKEVAAKIAGKLGELLSKKDTVSPADLTIPLQPESLPGQKSMFSMGADQYEKRWITLGAKGGEHRTRVQIDDDGRITAGPASLKGETLKSLKSRSSEIRAKAAHARASGKGGRDFTAKQAAALAGNHRVLQYDAAKQAARLAGVAVHDVIKAMPEAYRFIKEQAELKERAKDRARILTGLNAGVLAQIENSHRDYSSVPGFDEAAHAVAMEHPELGLDPDDTDTPAAVWDLIREGKQDPPAMHSPEVAKLAAQWVKPAKKVKAHDDWDAVPFSRASRLDAPERYSVKWNESEHPRDATGKWSEKGNGSVSHQFKIDSDARKKWLDTGTAAAFRVQDSRYPLPEKSKSTWNGDDSETMPGVSGYANLINAWQDIMLGRTESATGDNYSSQVEQSGGTPSLVVMQGREIDGPGAEIIVPNPKIAAVFHKKDLEKSFRDFIGQEYGSLDEHDYRTAPIEEILNSYEWSEDDFENAVKHLLAEQSR